MHCLPSILPCPEALCIKNARTKVIVFITNMSRLNFILLTYFFNKLKKLFVIASLHYLYKYAR